MFQGHLDSTHGGLIQGWAFDPSRADEAIFVDIFFDGKLLARVCADLHRPDLEGGGVGSGRHSFVFDLPHELMVDDGHNVRVQFSDTGVEIAGSPRTVPRLSAWPSAWAIKLDQSEVCLAEAAGFAQGGASTLRTETFAQGSVQTASMTAFFVDGTAIRMETTSCDSSEPAARSLSIPHGRTYPWGAFGLGPGSVLDSSFQFMPVADYELLRHLHDDRFLFDRRCIHSVERVDREVVHIFRPGAFNHYHWLIDVLPQLWCLKQSSVAHLPILLNRADFRAPRAMSEDEISLRLQSLELLGYGPDRLHWVDAEIVDTLVLHVPLATQGLILKAARGIYHELRARCAPTSSPQRKVYLTRRRATARRVINEDAILEVLRSLDFEVVETEDLSFSQQVALFSSVDVLVAPHGAGLANVAFCQAGTKILELLPAPLIDRKYIFARIAACFGHRQGALITEDVQGSLSDPDMVVPPAAIIAALEALNAA